MRTVADWSVNEWKNDFPLDTIDTYLDLFHRAVQSGDHLPCVFVAYDDQHQPIGTVTLIDDDELPNATEPGPWLAALFVLPEFRRHGVGTMLVDAVIEHAQRLQQQSVFLYTEDKVEWYESTGWNVVRHAELAGHQVSVMTRNLTAETTPK